MALYPQSCSYYSCSYHGIYNDSTTGDDSCGTVGHVSQSLGSGTSIAMSANVGERKAESG